MIVIFSISCWLLLMQTSMLERIERVSFATFAIYIVCMRSRCCLPIWTLIRRVAGAMVSARIYGRFLFSRYTPCNHRIRADLSIGVRARISVDLSFRDSMLWASLAMGC